MNVYLLCSALLVILYFSLSFHVSMCRKRTNKLFGTVEDATSELDKAIRTQGNAGEYIPILVALFLYFHSAAPGSWVLWTAIIVTIARFCHAAGMLLSPTLHKPHPLRFIGALLTYVCGFLLGAALL